MWLVLVMKKRWETVGYVVSFSCLPTHHDHQHVRKPDTSVPCHWSKRKEQCSGHKESINYKRALCFEHPKSFKMISSSHVSQVHVGQTVSTSEMCFALASPPTGPHFLKI